MAERPILFSAPMVRAILAGKKTQTRRVMKPHPPIGARFIYRPFPHEPKNWQAIGANDLMCWYGDCRYGSEGDALWVRETFANMSYACDPDGPNWTYRADTPPTDVEGWALPPGVKWTPSIHMPRVASRITLRVTGIRAERLQEISEADAIAEGVNSISMSDMPRQAAWSERQDFAHLWDTINFDRAPWSSNPWVWVVQFARM